MMMAIDEAREHDLVPAADDRHLGVLGLEFLEGPYEPDDTVLLQDRAVRDLLPGLAVKCCADHRTAADGGLGHDGISLETRNASLARLWRRTLLLGKGALHLILEVCSQFHAKLFALAQEDIARPVHCDRNNRLD